ncbi:MAG: ThuA domain-containing protein [Tannerella sp.]|jgi:type 1 glutamine amidotransferase|nr:ThuA domain-containing protein [Tannerella sp.]
MEKMKLTFKGLMNEYKGFTLYGLLGVFAIFLGMLSCQSPSQGLYGKKILVFTENGPGYVHDNIPASIDMFLALGEKEHFTVDTTSTSAVFATAALQQYDVIVFSNTNNDVFDSQAERDGLMEFVRSGKGVMGVHIACGTERNWDWFKQMMGGTFVFHPQFQEYPVWVVDHLHPSMEGVPSPWMVKDELYIMKEMNPTIHILMVSDFSSPDFKFSDPMPDTFGKVFPCVWSNTFDGGRQWFTALGHDKRDYSNPVYVSHILNGLKWITQNP